jgi:hypothetical protein
MGKIWKDITGQTATNRAIGAQQQGVDQTIALQREMYNQGREDMAPWREAGADALGRMGDNNFNQQFDYQSFQQDPGYQFRMNEGMKALQASAAARGNLGGGATLKALTRYGQDVASQEYQNAYNRFYDQQDRSYNRLASLAGVGQTTSGQLMGAGQNMANQIGQAHMGMGNAAAAAHMNQYNTMAGLAGQAFSAAGQAAGGGGGGGGMAAMFSDERLKTDLEDVTKADIDEVKSVLRAKIFQYSDEAYGQGDWVGVMAQDLEKSKLGRMLVFEDEDGHKKIDAYKAVSFLLAAMAVEG